ncbi:DUF222 domain-containing protein [Nocardioides sp. SYSU DS0663]|uniref:HNH endonuclease signature motif containing protein n=1 Tax=Nocardioides sp. SYSU DS0663 TaxID=3416445 RepID=UPI003F4C5024
MAKDLRPGGDHPVSRAVARLRAELDGLAEVPLFGLGPGETGATLVELTRLAAQVAELELRVAAHAEEVGVEQQSGATSTASWWAHQTQQDRRAAAGRVRLADALGRFHSVREALAAGRMNAEQARVVTRALDRLPDDLDPEVLARAERHLVAEAADHDPRALAIIGKHLLTVIAPEIGEAHDARALEREEREARAKAWLTMCPDGQGSVRGKFQIPSLHAAMLSKMLLAFAAPKHQAATKASTDAGEQQQVVERRPSPERMGDAFCELLERLPAEDLPTLGGLNASVVVLIDYRGLADGLARATLDNGEPISASMARRMACEAGLIPAVLGRSSELLDLGRTARFFSGAQRRALNITQPTCTAVGCDWPAYLCHAHHDAMPWSRDGRTDLADGRNLCPHHHARIHDPTYETTRHPDGQVTFHRRV